MIINILLAITFIILSLHASNSAHISPNLTASFINGLRMTTFNVIKQPVVKFINRSNSLTVPVLFNYADPQNKPGEWYEVSNTIRVVGRSDATLVQHVTYDNQSAIFFYPLDPRSDGSSSAGVKYIVGTWNLSEYSGFEIDVNRKGKISKFKFTIDGKCSETFECQSYDKFFQISEGRQQIKLPFSTFKVKFRGAQYSDSLSSFLRQVSRLRIQAYGDHNAPEKELGPGSIEIYYIRAHKLKPTSYYY